MNMIEMKLAFELEEKREAYQGRRHKAESELAEIDEMLSSLSIYTKAINKTMQQFDPKPMFMETLLQKLGIVDMEDWGKRKEERQKDLLRLNVAELERQYACRVAAVTYPYKRLIIVDQSAEHSWTHSLVLFATSRSIEEEMVLDSIWKDYCCGIRRFLLEDDWSMANLAIKNPNYEQFQEETRAELAKKVEKQDANRADAFDVFRIKKMKECLGQMTEEQYILICTDLLDDLRKFNALGYYSGGR